MDIPPRDQMTLTYTLADEPMIARPHRPDEQRSPGMDFQYDEFELIEEGGQPTYAQSIVFGNGWEMSIRFRDVQVAMAQPMFPLPGITPISLPGLPRSA